MIVQKSMLKVPLVVLNTCMKPRIHVLRNMYGFSTFPSKLIFKWITL